MCKHENSREIAATPKTKWCADCGAIQLLGENNSAWLSPDRQYPERIAVDFGDAQILYKIERWTQDDLDRSKREGDALFAEFGQPAPHGVVVGSIWRHKASKTKAGAIGERMVESCRLAGLPNYYKIEGFGPGGWLGNFRLEWEWVSDPPEPKPEVVVGSTWCHPDMGKQKVALVEFSVLVGKASIVGLDQPDAWQTMREFLTNWSWVSDPEPVPAG